MNHLQFVLCDYTILLCEYKSIIGANLSSKIVGVGVSVGVGEGVGPGVGKICLFTPDICKVHLLRRRLAHEKTLLGKLENGIANFLLI